MPRAVAVRGSTRGCGLAARGRCASPASRAAGLLLLALIAMPPRGCVSTWGISITRRRSRRTDPLLLVLPFENLTGDAAQDYFVDSVTDALTVHLARSRAWM